MKVWEELYGPTGPSKYAWIIDKDHLFTGKMDDRDDAGTISPRNATEAQIAALQARPKQGRKFKIYDDDGELYYTGRIIGVCEDDGIYLGAEDWDDAADFGPLWDFGTPNAGATEIRYKNEEGKWQTL